ncbi:MAG: hypothetical protein ABII22_02345 [Candidatus Micrarchaeota archaeon]
MVDVTKLRISKKSYRFEVKKKFENAQIYKPVKRSLGEQLKNSLSKMFKPKPKPKAVVGFITPPSAHHGFNFKLLFGAIIIAFILVYAGFAFYVQTISSFNEPVKVIVRGYFDSSIVDKGIITAGDRTNSKNIGYVRLDHKSSNIDSYSVNISVYDQYLPSEIFVLDSARYQADSFDEFFFDLKNDLYSMGMHVTKISIKDLHSMPAGAMIIVPSGQIPEEFLGDSGLLKSLTSKGSVIIYIGNNFDQMLRTSSDGQGVVVKTPDALKTNSVGFTASRPTCSGLGLYDSLYDVRGSSSLYGCVSLIKYGQGNILFLPQTLDSGWISNGSPDPALASKDISKIIYDAAWLKPSIENKYYYFNKSEDGITDFFTNTFDGDDKYVRFEIRSYSSNIMFLDVRTLHLAKNVNGDLTTEGGYIVSVEQTDSRIRMHADLKDPKPEEKQLYFVITKNGEFVGERTPFSRGPVSTITPVSGDVSVALDSGEYIAELVDDESYVYAKSYLKVVFLDIAYTGTNNLRTIAGFSIKKDGKPFKVTSEFKVSADNGKFGTYTFKDVSDVEVDVSKYVPDGLPSGEHIFTFTIGNVKKDVTAQTFGSACVGIFCKAEFIIVVVLAVGIFILGYYFAKKDKPIYQIDIPDFPPIIRSKVPLRTSEVLELFNKVNEDYKWNHSPLTITEFKESFKTIYHGGMSLNITDFNAEYVLDSLISRGLVKECLDYYAPSSWELASKKTTVYLAIFRKIRDICVNNAVPFTRMGEVKSCDTKITTVGQEMLVHIWSESGGSLPAFFKNLLKSSRDGINLVIFKDIVSKEAFYSYLLSPNPPILLVKMAVENGSIQLMTVDEFEKMVKDLKFV